MARRIRYDGVENDLARQILSRSLTVYSRRVRALGSDFRAPGPARAMLHAMERGMLPRRSRESSKSVSENGC